LGERALAAFKAQVMLAQGGEDGVDVLEVGRPRQAVDEHIIKKHQDNLMQERPEDGVHQALEHHRHVREPKGHNQELEMAFMSAECHFVHILGMHPDMMVAGAEI
jgi:hypothetical protein